MDKKDLKNELLVEVMSVGTNDIKQLEAALNKILSNYYVCRLQTTLPSTGDGSTTKYLFELFTKDKLAEGLSEKSIKGYFHAVKKLFLYVKKEVNLCTKDDIVGYITFYRYGGENYQNGYKQLSDNSVKNRFLFLSTFFKWLYKNKWIANNPFDDMKPPKGFIPKKEIITSAEVEKMIIACENNYKGIKLARNIALILLLLDSGLRANELCNLKINDIDFVKNTVHVENGKGGKERTTIMLDRSKERIKEYLGIREYVMSTDYLFTHIYKDEPLTVAGIENIINDVKTISGIDRLHPHLFRSTFATNLIENDVPMIVAKDLMGHSSLDTMENYVQPTKKLMDKSIYKIN